MSPKNAFDHHSHLGADVLSDGPIDGHVVSYCTKEFLSDDAKSFVPKNLHRAVVHLQCIVEGDFIFCQAKLFATRISVPHVLC